MAKPVTKKELLDLSKKGYDKIIKMIDKMPPLERAKEWKTKDRDKNVRDVIYHLYAWHQLMLGWMRIFEEGGHPHLPKEGYTWDMLNELNHEIWLEAQMHDFNDTMLLFENSHNEAMYLIESLSQEAIFTPYYKVIKQPVIGLLDGCMAEHYQWAIEQLNKHNVKK